MKDTRYILFRSSSEPEIYTDLSAVAKILGRHRNTLHRYFEYTSNCYRNVAGYTVFKAKVIKSNRGRKEGTIFPIKKKDEGMKYICGKCDKEFILDDLFVDEVHDDNDDYLIYTCACCFDKELNRCKKS